MTMLCDSIRMNPFSNFSVKVCFLGSTPCGSIQVKKLLKQNHHTQLDMMLHIGDMQVSNKSVSLTTCSANTRFCINDDISQFYKMSLH